MVLTRAIFALTMAAVLGLAAPAAGHENHQREQVAKEVEAGGAPTPGMTPGAMQERMEEHAEAMEDARPKTFSGRLMSWLGRTHPFAVHFPIALFPVALVALILARRRGETVELIRALIIVAGAASVIAALLGWLTGGFVLVDRDPIQLWHRWTGTALGLIGGAVMIWAWRRRDAVKRTNMVVALGLITAALLVQGWLGAAIVHGMEHMRF
jgi:uncharacterized membrane protein